MAVRSGISLDHTQILIHEPGRRGLEALYRKAAMPAALYGAVLAAVEVVDDTVFDGTPLERERFRSRVITGVLTLVETMDDADADYLLDRLEEVLVHCPAPASRGVAVTATL